MDKYCSFEELPLLLKVGDLIPVLGIGRNTAYELVRTGQIPSIRIGHQLRISKQSLIDFLRRSEVKSKESNEKC